MTDIQLQRRSDESLEDYQIRIIANKEKYDLTWNNVKDLLNKEYDEDYSESKYRKFYSAFIKGMEYAKEQTVTSEDVLSELELKKIELLEERKKLQTIRTEYNKIAREKARREMLFDEVRNSIETLPTPEFVVDTDYIHNDKNRSGVLSFGDIHFGKKFESLNNVYSEEIAKLRMEQLAKETIQILDKEDLNHIHIINGADSIEGMSLRVSQLQSLQSGFIDQTIKFSKFIAGWLNELSKYVKVTYHHIPSSNHSEIRPHGSSRGEFPSEDLEKVIMNYVHDVLENNERIEVPLYDNGFIDLQVLDFNVGALHGHQIKNNKHAIRDLSQLHRKFYDYVYVAHFHHGNALTVGQAETHNLEVIQIPSVMGSDEYSDTLMTGAKAGANFSVFEEGKGRTIQYNIILN